jgi:hypothetical protein
MASFVLDASATLPWCFRDETNEKIHGLLKKLREHDEAIVPNVTYLKHMLGDRDSVLSV